MGIPPNWGVVAEKSSTQKFLGKRIWDSFRGRVLFEGRVFIAD